MGRLKYREVITNIRRRCHSHSAYQPRSKIGQNISKHVFGDKDVETLRPFNQVERRGIHVHSLGLNVRKLLCDLVEDPPEVCHGGEYVCLIDQSYMFSARGRKPEGCTE